MQNIIIIGQGISIINSQSETLLINTEIGKVVSNTMISCISFLSWISHGIILTFSKDFGILITFFHVYWSFLIQASFDCPDIYRMDFTLVSSFQLGYKTSINLYSRQNFVYWYKKWIIYLLHYFKTFHKYVFNLFEDRKTEWEWEQECD